MGLRVQIKMDAIQRIHAMGKKENHENQNRLKAKTYLYSKQLFFMALKQFPYRFFKALTSSIHNQEYYIT